MDDETPSGWSEADSRHFIDVGRIHIPRRDEIGEVILDLLPVEADEPFTAVEIGVGGGWLSEALLSVLIVPSDVRSSALAPG